MHFHSHEHDHQHSHSHNHSHSSENIKTAFFLNLTFTLIEFVGGLLTNSLAIFSDALHDLGDTFSLGMSWYFDTISKRPRSKRFSYGWGRFSLLSALLSSIILVTGSIIIIIEAIPRLVHPESANVPGIIGIALLGICINGMAVFKMQKGRTMNEQVVFWHLLEDVLSWIAVLIGGIVMYFWDLPILDPILSIGIVLFVLWNVIKNLKRTIILFLQGVPEGMTVEEIEKAMIKVPLVISVHDTHIWTLDGERHILTTHVVSDVKTFDKQQKLKKKLKEILHNMHIEHATIELETKDEECEGDCTSATVTK